MSRSYRHSPVINSHPKQAYKTRRTAHHSLRQAIRRFLRTDLEATVQPLMDEVFDRYSLCDNSYRLWRPYRIRPFEEFLQDRIEMLRKK